MNNLPTDVTFYERLLAALDKYPFAAVLVATVMVVGIVAWAWTKTRKP
jgi:hypothetical protein